MLASRRGIAVVTAIVAAAAACFAPAPAPGRPCAEGGLCPSGLRCVAGVCEDDGGLSAACAGQPDGTPCGDAAGGDCDGADRCEGGACVANEAPDGATCDDCPAGAAQCTTCVLGACPDATCALDDGAPFGDVLESPAVGGNLNEGNMFDVVATETVTITSFETNTASAGPTAYEIWHKPGTHVGSETTPAAWTRLGAASFEMLGPDELTPIPIPVEVTILGGERHAFYLTHTEHDNRYHNGTAVGAVVATTHELTILEGVANDYGTAGFGPINTPRIWEGRIHYRSGGGAALATAMTGTAASDGVMFDVEARADVEASMLAVHLARGTHDVEVYFRRGGHAGHEADPAAWLRLAALPDVVSAGAGAPTVLPFAVDVILAAGTTTGFYVAVTTSAAALTAPATGMPAAIDGALTIGEGAALTGTFGTATPARPNVTLGYGACH